jgi:hypothetical protein
MVETREKIRRGWLEVKIGKNLGSSHLTSRKKSEKLK